ncbi:MAG TPA: cupin domain-containing protein [Pyrinomonadaceae bacterium]|jgi:quercetin dioxygenase-like cupin family protein
MLQRGKGNTVTIKVDPKTGSPSMAIGTQLLDAGGGIPVHMHEHEDEVLFVHEGGGVAVLGGERKVIGKGDTVYIPHGVWHGVETKDTSINLLWVVTPPGLEGFFREISSSLGALPKLLTPAQIEDIGHKHGVRFKPR